MCEDTNLKTRLLLSLMGIAGTALILGTGPALSETVSEAVEVRNAEPTSANDRESEDADRLLPLEVSEIQSAIGQQQAIAPKKSDRKTDNAQSLGNIAENPAPLNSAAAISESDNTRHTAIAPQSTLPPTISEKENSHSGANSLESTAVKDSETNGSQIAVASERNAVDTQDRSAFDAAAVNATSDRDRPQQQQQQQQQNPLQQMAQQVDIRSQQASSRQRQSPNVTPPLRPLLPQTGPNSGYNPNNNSGMFSANQQFPNMRNFQQAENPRFPMHPTMGPPQPHVSSSTHPNMGNGKCRRSNNIDC